MPLYGTPQSGGTLTSIIPGDSFTHFDGTETPSAGVTSIAFSRGYSPSGDDAGITWYVQFPLASPSAVVLIQGANSNVEANYQTLDTITDLQQAAYTDTGRAAFYRVKLSAYSSGGMPVVTAQR